MSAFMVRKEFDATQWLDADFCVYSSQRWATFFDSHKEAQDFAEEFAPAGVPFIVVEISDE